MECREGWRVEGWGVERYGVKRREVGVDRDGSEGGGV